MIHCKSTKFKLGTSLRRAGHALLAALTLLPFAAEAVVDTQCAKVKIEIQQELTLERQGFDAMMKITNGLTTSSLDNVNIIKGARLELFLEQ